MPICPKCKKNLEKDSRFCENCGFQITKPAAAHKFKLTKKVTVISAVAIMMVIIILTIIMNNTALHRKMNEIDEYVEGREAQIMHEISLFEEMKQVSDQALHEIDILTEVILQRDKYFKTELRLPGIVLLEEPMAMDKYYIEYVNDYVMENYAQSYANLVKHVDRFNELYDEVDHDLLSEYAILESMGFNACGFKICINEFNEAVQNREPHSVVEDVDYGVDAQRLTEIYKLDILCCYEGMFDFYQKLNADVLASKLIFDFE